MDDKRKIIKIVSIVVSVVGLIVAILAYFNDRRTARHDIGGVPVMLLDGKECANGTVRDVVIYADQQVVPLRQVVLAPTFSNTTRFSVKNFLLRYSVGGNVRLSSNDFFSRINAGGGVTSFEYRRTSLEPGDPINTPFDTIMLPSSQGSFSLNSLASYDGAYEPLTYSTRIYYRVVPRLGSESPDAWSKRCESYPIAALQGKGYDVAFLSSSASTIVPHGSLRSESHSTASRPSNSAVDNNNASTSSNGGVRASSVGSASRSQISSANSREAAAGSSSSGYSSPTPSSSSVANVAGPLDTVTTKIHRVSKKRYSVDGITAKAWTSREVNDNMYRFIVEIEPAPYDTTVVVMLGGATDFRIVKISKGDVSFVIDGRWTGFDGFAQRAPELDSTFSFSVLRDDRYVRVRRDSRKPSACVVIKGNGPDLAMQVKGRETDEFVVSDYQSVLAFRIPHFVTDWFDFLMIILVGIFLTMGSVIGFISEMKELYGEIWWEIICFLMGQGILLCAFFFCVA